MEEQQTKYLMLFVTSCNRGQEVLVSELCARMLDAGGEETQSVTLVLNHHSFIWSHFGSFFLNNWTLLIIRVVPIPLFL